MSTVRKSKLPENVRQRGRQYYFRCRINGTQKDLPLGPDLSVAKSLAKQHAARLLHIKAGFADPREERWAEAERKPLAEHVRDWQAYLLGKGNTEKHAEYSGARTLRLIESGKVLRISGLSLSVAQKALADLKHFQGRFGNVGMSDRSIYHHCRALKSFAKWLWSDGRTRENNLVHLALPEVNEFRVRKALEAWEVAALIEATKTQPRRASIVGPDRSILYAVAGGTGFRVKELSSLTPESFDLDANPPTITCLAEHTKNRRLARQPITSGLADLLRPWLEGKPPGEPVFVVEPTRTAHAIRKDLAAAGVESADSYDFHCLRHTYATLLIKSGASVKVCMELARHADPKLTLNTYGHLTVHDLANGVESLAHTLPTTVVSTGLTGTDGGPSISSPGRTGADPSRRGHRMEGPHDEEDPRG
jgi:site-specific recombinase XerD